MLGTVIVTGGASGLGAAVARTVAAQGGHPVVLDRVPAPEHDHEVVDLVDTAAAARAVDAVAARGPIDGVVTCAGTDACGPLADVPVDAWERVIAVNLLGTAAVVRAALPHLERASGAVVTIASTLGLRALPDATAYCASKFGVVGFTRSLSMEMAGRVRVTCVVPGGMRTAFFDGRTEQYRPGPDAHLMDPCDVAQVIVHALTQPASAALREIVVTVPDEPSWP